MDTYIISASLLRSIVAALNEMPAGRVRGVLNALDAEVNQQEEARRERARNELFTSLTQQPAKGNGATEQPAPS